MFHPLLRQFLNSGFNAFCSSIHGIVIRIAVNLVIPGNGDIDLGIVIHIQRFRQDIEIVIQCAVADSSRTTVHVHVQGAGDITHNREFLLCDGIQRIFLIVSGNCNGFADYRIVHMIAVDETFIGSFRHTAANEPEHVQSFGHRIKTVGGSLLSAAEVRQQIHICNPFRILNSVHSGNLVHMVFVPSIHADQTQIEHIQIIQMLLTCGNHIRLSHQQAHKHTGTQSNDHDNGQIPPEGSQYGLGEIFAHCISSHYHSISAISTGCSFLVTDVTVPLLT